MNIRYDLDDDALYLRFAEAAVKDSEEVRTGGIVDFDVEGQIVAIELLDASRPLTRGIDPSLSSAA